VNLDLADLFAALAVIALMWATVTRRRL